MQAIYNFFNSIIDALVFLVRIISDFLKDISYLVQITGSIVRELPTFFSFLPSSLLAVLTLIFSIVVIYKILGREG